MQHIPISLAHQIVTRVLRDKGKPRIWSIETIPAVNRDPVYPVGARKTGKAAERREAKKRRKAHK